MSQDYSQDQYPQYLFNWAEMTGTQLEAGSSNEGTNGTSSNRANQDTSSDAASVYSFHSSPPIQDRRASGTRDDYGSPLDTSPYGPNELSALPDFLEKVPMASLDVEEALAKFRLSSSSPCQIRGRHTFPDTIFSASDFKDSFGHLGSQGPHGQSANPNHMSTPGASVQTTHPPSFYLPLYRPVGWPAPTPGYPPQSLSASKAHQDASTDHDRGQQPNPWSPSFIPQRTAPAVANAGWPFRAAHSATIQPTQVLQRQQEPAEQVFRPMHAALARQQSPTTISPYQQPMPPQQQLQPNPIEKVMLGFSPNYMGNIHIPRNKSANIPEEENCSLWLTGLPADITYTQILSAITNVGRVYQTHINTPEPEKGHHTSACKVVFFDRASAQRFWDRFAGPGFVVPDAVEVGRVAWNRVRSAAVEGPKAKELSRVLLISGPRELVNASFLTNYFRSKLEFNIDVVLEHKVDQKERALVEYRFASFRCQAESAKMAITRELWAHNVQVWFWADPCDFKREGEGEVAGGGLDGFTSAGRAAGGDGHAHPAYTARSWRE